MQLESFSKALADQTRLRLLMLIMARDELCVCDLTQALQLAQPKISRHLAILRETGLLQDRKAGLWVYYRVHPQLAPWAQQALHALSLGSHHEAIYQQDLQRLQDWLAQAISC